MSEISHTIFAPRFFFLQEHHPRTLRMLFYNDFLLDKKWHVLIKKIVYIVFQYHTNNHDYKK